MRLVFAGTPDFAIATLDAIIAAGHQVLAVLTQPDRRSGRGMRVEPGPVKQLALAHGIPVLQPASLRAPEVHRQLVPWFGVGMAEVMVVAAYGIILPQAVLALPRFGCLNIHASLLPRWRGAAPIERALLSGDRETGVCIMQMDAGLDTGPVLQLRSLAIDSRDTAGSLREKLANLGAATMVEVLDSLDRGASLAATPQEPAGATYAKKIDKLEAALELKKSSIELDCQIRALDPAPGAFAMLRGRPIKIWVARPGKVLDQAQAPGTVRAAGSEGLLLACGADGCDTLIVEELQRPAGKRLRAAQFLQGFPIATGERFVSPA
jgi:methionyl-tRNA formyltransferase